MDLNEKLVNVRRAVRLLAGWHARVLDMLQKVEIELSAVPGAKMRFLEWRPIQHASVEPPERNPLHRWGWDFLPLQSVCFRWASEGKEQVSGGRSLGAWVQVIVDDGYAKTGVGPRGPDPMTFAPAEECHSWLEIWVVGALNAPAGHRWADIEAAIEEQFDEVDMWSGALVRVTADQMPGLPNTCPVQYAGWRIDLSMIGTEADFTTRVLLPLRERSRAVLALPG